MDGTESLPTSFVLALGGTMELAREFRGNVQWQDLNVAS